MGSEKIVCTEKNLLFQCQILYMKSLTTRNEIAKMI